MEKVTDFLNAFINALHALANFIDGYKTYLVAMIIIVQGIVQGDTTTILMGLAVLTGRQAIGKAIK